MSGRSPFAQMRRIYERGPRSRGLVVDRDGVALGPDAVLVRPSAAGYRCARTDDLVRLTQMVFANDAHLQRLSTVLAQIARALDAGDLVKAQLLGLEIPIGQLDDNQLARLAGAADVVKAGFDPSQPRDEGGRWTSEGGGDGAAAAGVSPVRIADAGAGVSDVGGILPRRSPANSADNGTSEPAATAAATPPAPSGTGDVREYSPEGAAKLPPPPAGSKYVTLNDGSVVWSKYSNHGQGGPMLMPKDVSLADNARFGESLRGYDDLPTEPDQLDPKQGAMIALFAPYLGTMDYQRKYSADGHVNKDYIDIGNYNYGIVAAAAGYSWEEATEASGLANLPGKGDKDGPWWNNPRNLAMIKKGYDDYEAGRITPRRD